MIRPDRVLPFIEKALCVWGGGAMPESRAEFQDSA